MKKLLFTIACLFSIYFPAQSQEKVQALVAFYNVENLFDTEDDSIKNDEEYLPTGRNEWTQERYKAKLKNIAKVINSLGGGHTPDIMGLCEIENRRVVEDLVTQPALAKNRYQIVHFDAPDRRGIDVGLIYKPQVFVPFHTKPLPLNNPQDTSFKTRDILYVKGLFQRKDTLHIFVNHWPSRRGGKEDMRIEAGKLARSAVDSILQINPDAKIILMGDFNDDPTNKSIANYLRAQGKEKKLTEGDLFNPSFKPFKQGYGSLKYRGAYNLFDQIIISQGLLKKNADDVYYMPESFRVFAADWLQNKSGKYAGYPFRTFAGGVYTGGYSDHFPSFIVIGGK